MAQEILLWGEPFYTEWFDKINNNFTDLFTGKLDSSLTKSQFNTACSDNNFAFIDWWNTFTADQSLSWANRILSIGTNDGSTHKIRFGIWSDAVTIQRTSNSLDIETFDTMDFKRRWVDIMTINNSWNVWIGTTSPVGLLELKGNSWDALGVWIFRIWSNWVDDRRLKIWVLDWWYWYIQSATNIANDANLILNPELWNVWIWTTSPWEKLHVNWGLRIGTTTNAVAWNIRWNGTKFQWYDGTAWRDFH